ncbi:hypothetical protein BX666DRAFT_2031107 [Dichotomocladium elegans]|nr:hypothetical protein BX666DRAFT_2031107 [Dichotomocladium elegans]
MLTETSTLAHFLRTTGPSSNTKTVASTVPITTTASQPSNKRIHLFRRTSSFKSHRPLKSGTPTTNVPQVKHIPLLVHYPPSTQQEGKTKPKLQHEARSQSGISTRSLPQGSTTSDIHSYDHSYHQQREQQEQQQQQQQQHQHHQELPEREDDDANTKILCYHCKSPSPVLRRTRRLSCPGAIHYAPAKAPQLTSKEAKTLLSMIEKLQAQLAIEQASRRALELALENQL